jgi:hypothetical protein
MPQIKPSSVVKPNNLKLNTLVGIIQDLSTTAK